MMRNLTLALGIFLFVLSGRSNAGLIELNLSASIASGEYTAPTARDRAALQFFLTAPAFTVNDGDSVRVNLMFENGTSFRLLFDPSESVVGTQGWLTLGDPNAPLYVVEFGFSFTFLDTNGNSILSASSARAIRSGGDLRGDVSIPMVEDLNVGGLSMEFSDIRNASIGGLPVTFGGAGFLIHNALFGEPFNQVPPITVAIDIKPGSFPNSINPKSKGVIPVAILTTNTFDATTVDSTTVLFGKTGTEAAPVHSALEDVDGDGGTDMILHFNTQDTGIVCGNTSASLTGETFGGQMIEGADSIKTVGCK